MLKCKRSYAYVRSVLILLGCLLCLTGCRPQSFVSTKSEIDIGRQAARQVEGEYRVDPDPRLNALVNNLGQTLVKNSDRQDIKYTFKVLDIKDVNAFSLPGGWVYVNKGLIDATRGRSDQLAGVIAHEIGHVVARHGAQMIGREIQANILLGTLTRGQTQQIASLFANFQLLHYNREQEYQADQLGVKEMWRCSKEDPQAFNPQGLIDFFGYLAKIEGHPPSGFEKMIRDHPATPNRIKAAQAYLDDLRAGKADP